MVKGAKELFIITPNSEGEFPTILTKDYLNSGMPVISAEGAYLTKSFTRTFIDMGANYYEDYYIVNPAFKSGEKAAVLIATYRPNKPDNPVSINVASEKNMIPLFYNGDGTKFLSDDGTYKEINLDSKPAYHNICLDNYSDNIMSSDDFNELSLAIENQVPIIILLTGGNFIGSSACDATMDPGGNITLFYTIMSIEGDLRYFRTLILSNDLSITIEELFNSSKINLAIQPEDLATTTTPGLMSAEDKAKLDQVTAVNTSIVTQAEYDALVSAGAATSGTVYYIRG